MIQLKYGGDLRTEGFNVVVSSICIGNIAQLACDLLISSRQLKKIGSIAHPALIPLFGPAAFQHAVDEKTTACEIYASQKDKLIIIQFRTPLVSKHAADFHRQLANILKDSRRVVILSSSLGFEKHAIDAGLYEYFATDAFKKLHASQLQQIKWSEIKDDVIVGSGNSLQLYKSMDEQNVPVALLVRYLLEGNNSTDAASILNELRIICDDFLHITITDCSKELILPKSWNLLFGNDVIPDLTF